MQDILLAVASRLGIDANALEFGDTPTSIYGEAEEIRIKVFASLRVGIHFEELRPYP